MLVIGAGAGHSLHVITGPQIRAARGLLGWRQLELAKHAKINEQSVKRIESGETDARGSTLAKIVVFLDRGDIRDGGPGVRMKR